MINLYVIVSIKFSFEIKYNSVHRLKYLAYKAKAPSRGINKSYDKSCDQNMAGVRYDLFMF